MNKLIVMEKSNPTDKFTRGISAQTLVNDDSGFMDFHDLKNEMLIELCDATALEWQELTLIPDVPRKGTVMPAPSMQPTPVAAHKERFQPLITIRALPRSRRKRISG
ncbi:hypothetical protein CEXT_728271 [Caerostris extrusa]|uniref:Uncharacterized protein n=1 Tax=Caerostris extrusa TaxID=172846 RepID=A0AAV4PA66_CAEEX|nr:hypothetical protein CEXT_728271 [Caerostris extrusa]